LLVLIILDCVELVAAAIDDCDGGILGSIGTAAPGSLCYFSVDVVVVQYFYYNVNDTNEGSEEDDFGDAGEPFNAFEEILRRIGV
jgi:hypothetical protein